MDEKTKITFADSYVPTGKVGWIHGLPLTVSPGASDLLAGIHLAFQLMQQFTGMMPATPPQQVVMPGEPEAEDEGNTLDLAHLNSLSPLARAEVLAMHGRAMREPIQPELDPTADEVAKIVAEAQKNIRRQYEPSDEGEVE